MTNPASIPVICIAGPTGAGKTAAALAVAREFGAEVINTDSRQVYRDFPIVTAQPNPEERSVCPHHLYGIMGTEEKLSAGIWSEHMQDLARQILSRGSIPLLVGGTGFYFNSALHGIANIPDVEPDISAALKERCINEGSAVLHAELERIDPVYARRIHPNDRQRVVRAMEVWLSTGRTFSWWHENATEKPVCVGPLIGIGTSLSDLTPRLDARIDIMISCGAVDEVENAMKVCADRNAPGWSGIGCAELYAFLQGELHFTEARKLWLRNTRAYAKRQITWFKARKEIEWFPLGDKEAVVRRVSSELSRFPSFSR